MSWEKVPSSTGRMIEKTLSTWILEGLKKQDTGKSETREIPHIYQHGKIGQDFYMDNKRSFTAA